MNDSIPPLLPAIVICCRQHIMAVRLPDGRVVGIIQSICEPLQLDRTAQIRRIRRNESLARHLLLVPVLTNGGVQKMDALVASAIPRWLEGIQVSRLAPAKRPLARALQRELEDSLNRHFSRRATGEAMPPPPEQPRTPPNSPRTLIWQGFQLIDEAVQMFEARQQATDERVVALEQRQEVFAETQQAMGDYVVETRQHVTALEQRMNAAPGSVAGGEPASGGALLSPQHLAQAYVLARAARRRSGESITKLLATLAEAFGVEDVSDLPDSAWGEVLHWFEGRARDG